MTGLQQKLRGKIIGLKKFHNKKLHVSILQFSHAYLRAMCVDGSGGRGDSTMQGLPSSSEAASSKWSIH